MVPHSPPADRHTRTAVQISQLKSKKVQDWLDEQKAGMDITSEAKPTPTPADEQFEAPPDAPPTPTSTPTAIASPEGEAGASPQAQ